MHFVSNANINEQNNELERSKTSIYKRIMHTQTGVESYQEPPQGVGFVRISNIKGINLVLLP